MDYLLCIASLVSAVRFTTSDLVNGACMESAFDYDKTCTSSWLLSNITNFTLEQTIHDELKNETSKSKKAVYALSVQNKIQ